MQIEFHIGANRHINIVYKEILESLERLGEFGFRPTMFTPNGVMEKTRDFDRTYHNYFDVLFVRK